MGDFSECPHGGAIGYCDICSPGWEEQMRRDDVMMEIYERGNRRGREEAAKLCGEHLNWLVKTGQHEKARTAATLHDLIWPLPDAPATTSVPLPRDSGPNRSDEKEHSAESSLLALRGEKK